MIPEDPDAYLYLLSPFDVLGTKFFLFTLLSLCLLRVSDSETAVFVVREECILILDRARPQFFPGHFLILQNSKSIYWG